MSFINLNMSHLDAKDILRSISPEQLLRLSSWKARILLLRSLGVHIPDENGNRINLKNPVHARLEKCCIAFNKDFPAEELEKLQKLSDSVYPNRREI